jgi:hypothetical protein
MGPALICGRHFVMGAAAWEVSGGEGALRAVPVSLTPSLGPHQGFSPQRPAKIDSLSRGIYLIPAMNACVVMA